MQNARLDEAQTGIKIAGRNINNLRYANDTSIVAEREEELKSLLMKVKQECEKVGLKYSLQPKIGKLYTVSKNKTGSWLAQIMNSLLPNSDLNWRK